MLYIFLVLTFGLAILFCAMGYDEDVFLIIGVSNIILFAVLFVVMLFSIACYNEVKTTADKQILILEEKNEIVLKQIEPLVEKYLNYENDTLSKFKVDANNLVALSMFPELKGNEFIKSQIDIVIKNQDEITKLKLEKAKLNAYKLWLFMGE